MLRLSRRTTAIAVTALIAALAAVEVWVLTSPLLTEMPVGLPPGWSARDASVLFDLILALPLFAVALIAVWSRPAGRGLTVAVPGWLKPWIRPRRLAYLLVPPLLTQLLRLDLGLGQLVAIVAGLAVVGELFSLGVAALLLTRLYRATRAVRGEGYTLSTSVMVAAGRALPVAPIIPALRLALAEVAQLYYVSVGWFVPARRQAGRTFTYHRRRDETILIALMLMLTIEMVPVHVVVHHYSALAAWILTGLHLYSLLWVLGPLVTARRRPHTLTSERLRLTDGLWREAVIELRGILSVTDLRELAEGEEPPTADVAFGSRQDVLLELSEPVVVYGLFGGSRDAALISLDLDDPEAFLASLRESRP